MLRLSDSSTRPSACWTSMAMGREANRSGGVYESRSGHALEDAHQLDPLRLRQPRQPPAELLIEDLARVLHGAPTGGRQRQAKAAQIVGLQLAPQVARRLHALDHEGHRRLGSDERARQIGRVGMLVELAEEQ